jgi:hypothetical protein
MLNEDISCAKKKGSNNSRSSDLREIIYIMGKSVQHPEKSISEFNWSFQKKNILDHEKKNIVN